jgi:hypothetical protein
LSFDRFSISSAHHLYRLILCTPLYKKFIVEIVKRFVFFYTGFTEISVSGGKNGDKKRTYIEIIGTYRRLNRPGNYRSTGRPFRTPAADQPIMSSNGRSKDPGQKSETRRAHRELLGPKRTINSSNSNKKRNAANKTRTSDSQGNRWATPRGIIEKDPLPGI